MCFKEKLRSLNLFLVQILKLMEYDRLNRIFIGVLKHSSPKFGAFAMMLLSIILAFALSGNILFGRYVHKYSTLLNGIQECVAMAIGE